MASYKAPIRDMQFVLHELLQVEQEFAQLPGFEETSADVIDAILDEGAKLCENVIAPTNRRGDEQGCHFENGAVTTPDGFKEAYAALQDGGWLSLGGDPDFGGQGLPHTLSIFFEEMLQSANMALFLYPGLTRGAYMAMKHHASDELNALYLPKMVSGQWTGVMCLTEPHCGTDLGLLRTRAQPSADGSYQITGNKIFITGGEQDLTENILHLVLAKLPDAPSGVKGISLFIVPKIIPNADGSLGERNTLSCASIESKMGIKGASTCVMNYDGAQGWLVGEPHKGLRAMFSMMNHERIMVGQQGLSQAEVAYQSAAEYARDRLQSRSLSGVKAPDKMADPIIVHPDIRRMLLTTRALNESARALLGWVGLQIDIAERDPDPKRREQSEDRIALLIPVIKAYFTDYGFDCCVQCQQVLGGHGYIAEWGMEQLVRDARIAQIYEGANGIHALDLVARKLPMHDGRLIKGLINDIESYTREHTDNPQMREFIEPLKHSVGLLTKATDWIADNVKDSPDVAGSSSYDYLRLLALTSLAWMWARSASIALSKREGDNSGFYENKLLTARFFMSRLLPQADSLLQSLCTSADVLMDMEADAF